MKLKKPIKPKKTATTSKKAPPKSKTTRRGPSRRTTSAAPAPLESATINDLIARRAFENYERRIRQGPLDDWLQAEQEILGSR